MSKPECFISDRGSETEKLNPVYCSNHNEANIKNVKWCVKRGLVVLSFSGYQEEALEEQKHKDEDETINLIEKQVVERDQVAKYFIGLDDLWFYSKRN